MFYVIVYNWKDAYGWCAIEKGDTKVKEHYKRYMNALTAIHNEIDRLELGNTKTWQYTDDEGNFKTSVETENRLYVIMK